MKKTVSYLLCFLLLLSLCAPAASALEVREGWIELPHYAAPAAVSENYSAAAAHILSSLKRGENPIDVSEYHISRADALSVFVGLLSDHPEYFYIKTGLSYTYNPATNTLIDITYFETASGDVLEAQKAALSAAAAEVLAGVGADMTEIEKALYLHDTLALRVAYDYENYDAGSIPDADYTAYGALVDGSAVCQGYAMAFTFLAKQLGMESCFISSSSMNHGWNAVRIDGKWYYLDVTQDDAILSMHGSYVYNADIGHSRFLLSESELTAAGYASDRQIISLEHRDISCTDSLDGAGYLWQERGRGPFFYAGGRWYCAEGGTVYHAKIDQSDRQIYYQAPNAYGYSRFRMQGGRLYYNTRDEVYAVSLSGGLAVVLAAENGGTIVGLGFCPDGRLMYEGFDDANRYYRRFITLDSAAEDVTAQIAALPWFVTASDRTAVEAARTAYNALPADRQADVSNLPVLEEAERILRELDTGLPFKTGDVNRDRMISVSDVVALRQIILLGGDGYVYDFTDIDGDRKITVTDVVALRRLILDAA